MKAYTDIKQSKKLAEILPLESADMHYNNVSIKGINYVDEYRAELMEYNRAIKVLSKYTINPLFEIVPCWSLAALLEIIPEPILTYIDENNWNISTFKDNHFKEEVISTNPLNACYEMIIKLNEQKLL